MSTVTTRGDESPKSLSLPSDEEPKKYPPLADKYKKTLREFGVDVSIVQCGTEFCQILHKETDCVARFYVVDGLTLISLHDADSFEELHRHFIYAETEVRANETTFTLTYFARDAICGQVSAVQICARSHDQFLVLRSLVVDAITNAAECDMTYEYMTGRQPEDSEKISLLLKIGANAIFRQID